MKNIFFIIIDALRMDSLNDDMSEKIAPNLKKMCSKGLVEKIITNGQVTKFVVPSIFTQTFPLDYGVKEGLHKRNFTMIKDYCWKDF